MTEQPGGTDRQSPPPDAMELDATQLEEQYRQQLLAEANRQIALAGGLGPWLAQHEARTRQLMQDYDQARQETDNAIAKAERTLNEYQERQNALDRAREVVARYDQPPVVQPPVVQPPVVQPPVVQPPVVQTPVVQTPSQPLTDEQKRAQRGSKFKKELEEQRAQEERKRKEQEQYAARFGADKRQKPVTFSPVSSRKHYDGNEQDRDWIRIVDQSGRNLRQYIEWQLTSSNDLTFKPPDSSDHLYKVTVTIPFRTTMSIVALVKSNEIFVIHAGPGSLF